MGKHGKNATANPVYSNHERMRDKERRIGTDSIQDVDCCYLTLQPTENPVITPHGYLYDREAILTNLLHQKQEHSRKTKEFLRQKKKHEKNQKELEMQAKQDELKKFESMERNVVSAVGDHFKQEAEETGEATRVIQEANALQRKMFKTGDKDPALAAFWVPGLVPDAKPTWVKKPVFKSRCPISGKPLKMKDLISVKFTVADRHSKESIISRQERYMCPITQTVLRKGIACAVLKPSGRVVTTECVQKIIRPDMLDPISGEKLKESDIIFLKLAGTGFAGSGADLTKKRKGAAQMVG